MAENQYETKSLNYSLPKPIAFNCWKHHLGFIKKSLSNQTNYSKSESFILDVIQFLGESQFDLYTGTLNEVKISEEVIHHLKSVNALDFINYNVWLNSDGNDYKCISLSDGSNWTLRLGQGDDRYIHIHPSRHSKKTQRVKNSTLKTAYAYLFYYGISSDEVLIEKVNFVRRKFVKLPPFKPTSALVAVCRILDLFTI
jgi:hypothetical protein